MSAGVGCDVTVTVRTRCGGVRFRECGEFLCGRGFVLKQKGAVFKSYVRPVILYRSEAWCLRDSLLGIVGRTRRSMVRVMCGVQLKDRKRAKDLMLMKGLKKLWISWL